MDQTSKNRTYYKNNNNNKIETIGKKIKQFLSFLIQ